MIEYRTERVDPLNKDDVIEILAAFGWQAMSAEEVYREDTEVVGVDVKSYGDGAFGSFMRGFTGKDGEINVRRQKTITNYVEIHFARDTEMYGYSRVKALNDEFESKMNTPTPHKPIKRTAVCVIGIALIIVSLILALVEHNTAEIWEIVVCVAFPVIMIPITVVGWVQYKRRRVYYEATFERLKEVINLSSRIVYGGEEAADGYGEVTKG